MRRPQYWRIEVPVDEQEDALRAQQLRDVFDAILQFEKTECPFQRSFTVELPDLPDTPAKKRPWTPARRSSETLPLTPTSSVAAARLLDGTPRGLLGDKDKERGSLLGDRAAFLGDLRKAYEARHALVDRSRNMESFAEEPGPREPGRLDDPSFLHAEEHHGSPAGPRGRLDNPGTFLHVERQYGSAAGPRVPLVAPQLMFDADPADPSRPSVSRLTDESYDPFRSPWLHPPSPPLSTPTSPRRSFVPTQDLPPITSHTTAKRSHRWSLATTSSIAESVCSTETAPSSLCDPDSTSAFPQLPQLASTKESEEPKTPSKPVMESSSADTPTPTQPTSNNPPIVRRRLRRATTSSTISPVQPALSNLPAAAHLFTPNRPRSPPLSSTTPTKNNSAASNAMALSRIRARLPLKAVVQSVLNRTRELLSSPPGYLLRLMLNVAARIVAGEWRGMVLGLGEGGERVSVAWELEFDMVLNKNNHGEGSGKNNGWGSGFEDDGGVWGMRGRKGRRRMVGAFPDSESDDGDDDDERDDDEEGVGPLDCGPRGKVDGEVRLKRRRERRERLDAEWGVD